MKKLAKAISALAFAVVMSLSLGAVAFADDGAAATIDSTTFKVKFTPSEDLQVPAMTFNYSIVKGDEDLNANPKIYAGIDGISLDKESVSFAANDAQAAEGTDVTITFPTKFPNAGIYRYKVIQAKFTDAQVNAGILNENGNGRALQKTLDLYVNADGKVVSAVLYKVSDNSDKTGTFANTFGKKGDPNDPDPTNPDPTNPDPYNPDPDDPDPIDPNDPDGPGEPANAGKHVITLSKTVTGAMGDKNELFPFDVTVSSTNNTLAGVNFTANVNGVDQTWTLDATKLSITNDSIQLKHGQNIVLTVPNDVTIAVKEKTDAAENYLITSEAKSGFNAGATVVSKVKTDTGFSGYLDNADETGEVIYTNDRETISPTGVALRFAPYLLILAAGAIIFLVSRSRKSDMVD